MKIPFALFIGLTLGASCAGQRTAMPGKARKSTNDAWRAIPWNTIAAGRAIAACSAAPPPPCPTSPTRKP